jgi:hypothetical protein
VLTSGPADDRYRDDRPREARGNVRAATGRRGRVGERGGGPDRPGPRGGLDRPRERGRGPGERGRPPGEPPPPPVPVRKLLSIVIAGFALLLSFGLVIGSQATRTGFSVVVFGVQVLFVLAWTVASRPPAPSVVGGVGVLAAAAATIAVNLPQDASLAPVAYVVAAALIAGVVGQLFRRGGRLGVTESMSVTMIVVLGSASFASLIVLDRRPLGGQVLIAGLVAAGLAIATARICDILIPNPRMAPQVPRGSAGVIAGAMAGTAAAGVIGGLLVGLRPLTGALTGMIAGLVAVVVDLGSGYAEAGRRLEGEAPFMWLARHMQGPLGAFAFAAPACYVVGVILR